MQTTTTSNSPVLRLSYVEVDGDSSFTHWPSSSLRTTTLSYVLGPVVSRHHLHWHSVLRRKSTSSNRLCLYYWEYRNILDVNPADQADLSCNIFEPCWNSSPTWSHTWMLLIEGHYLASWKHMQFFIHCWYSNNDLWRQPGTLCWSFSSCISS